MEEIERYRQLQAFYAKNGILKNPLKPIEVDLASLGLDLNEKDTIQDIDGREKTFTLGEAAEDVIERINERIANNKGFTEKATRYVILRLEGKMLDYNHLGLSEGEQYDVTKIWLRRIIKALADNGHIFGLAGVTGAAYFIQA